MYDIIILLVSCIMGVLTIQSERRDNFQNSVFDDDLYINVLNPALCRKHLRDMRTFEFYDASFRPPQGLLKGNFVSMGNFHQCLEIKQNVKTDVIEGKYCMVRAKCDETLKLPLLPKTNWLKGIEWVELSINSTKKAIQEYENTLRIGNNLGDIKRIEEALQSASIFYSLALCIPKTCSVDDVLGPFSNNGLGDLTYKEGFCRLPGDKPLVAADYTAIAVFLILGILTLLSTAYDIRHRFILKKDPVKESELLRCFSLYTNTSVFLSFSNSSPGMIDCIDGIRSLSIMWIIIGHTAMTFATTYTANLFDFFDWFGQSRSIWIRSSTINVDTFLILSGLLLVYVSVKKINQMQLLKNLHLFYLSRLLRMFPLLGCAVLLQASVFNQVADGVSWHYMAREVKTCRKYWWSALLHVQNIVNPEEYCIAQTWYLSVDVQLHILSPLLLFWVLGSRRSAWNGLTIGLIVSLTASTAYCFLKDFSQGSNYLIYFYKNTLTRAPPFVIGMAFGYVLHVFRGRNLKLSFWWVTFGYISAWVVSWYCLYDSYADWGSKFVDNLNLAFMRSCWGLCLCWIIFTSVNGYGGPINWFLSLTIWKFMARISYAMYLFHPSIMLIFTSSTVTPLHFSLDNLFQMYFRAIVYTVIASVAACVVVDAPFAVLQKMLFKSLTSSSKTTVDSRKTEPAPENGNCT